MRYVILGHDRLTPAPAAIERALNARGWERWDGTGDPDICVFNYSGPKGDYFEAGFWNGRGAHTFFLGGGARCVQRKQIVGRLGGWTVVGADRRCTAEDLAAAVERWRERRAA